MSPPDTFRDALARAYDGPDGPFAHSTADAVLASDEMQTLRLVARGSFTVHQLRLLHPSVRAWVLDDPSPDSPTDKPCETCGGYGRIPASACPSCRGGEPT